MGYDEDYSVPRYYRWYHRLIYRALVRRCLGRVGVGRGARLLDIGCGEGTVSECFAREGLEVFGLDVSRVGIARAAARAAVRAGPAPRYVVADALAPPVRPGAFDMVYARSFPPVMEMLSRGDARSLGDLTRRMLGCLRPGGWLCLSLPVPRRGNRGRYRVDFRDTAPVERAYAPFGAEVFLLNRLDIFLLGGRAFSRVVSRANRWWLRLAPRGGEVVVFIQNGRVA